MSPLNKSTKLISRDTYVNKALLFKDTDLIKVLTGVRRSGKSSLLQLIKERIISMGAEDDQCITLNLESLTVKIQDYIDLYNYFGNVLSKSSPTAKMYIFIDEPQIIAGWEKAINSLRVDFDCDIYITGSNAYLLSSELSTYLSGRYVEIKVLPLSFSEYVNFCGLHFNEDSSVAKQNNKNYAFDDIFDRYLKFGGMPAIANLKTDEQLAKTYFEGMYNAIVTRDILNRERSFNASKVANAPLLKNICYFLADNIGNKISAPKMSNVLTAMGSKTSHLTVKSYIDALNEAYLFYQVNNYDLHGKDILRNTPKQYIVDLGLKSYLSEYRVTDTGRIFENAVYLELMYKGWNVHVGKLYDKEIDFVATKDSKKIFIQAAESISGEETINREVAPLKSIRESYPKLIVTKQNTLLNDVDGIQVLPAKKFFL